MVAFVNPQLTLVSVNLWSVVAFAIFPLFRVIRVIYKVSNRRFV
jgi:hypothetical protein